LKIKQLSNPWVRRLGLLALAGMAGTIMVLTAAYLYLAPQLPPTAALKQVEYQIPLRVYARDGKLLAEFGEKRRTPVTYEQLPKRFVRAVLAAEDKRFFRHGGVDLKGLMRAALELLWYQDIRSGGSTITMQVARNFFLGREQKFLRKFNEIVLALEIENQLTKQEILELYLNKIYLGHRAYGAEAAAQVYYGRSISELSLAQWAMIAGLPKAPSAYNPISNPERARTRRDWILGQMAQIGAIDDATRDAAQKEPISASYHGPAPDVEAAYIAEMVRQEMVARYGKDNTYTAGLEAWTTLDSQLQTAAVSAVRAGLHEYDERHGWRGPMDSRDVSTLPELVPLSDFGVVEATPVEVTDKIAPVTDDAAAAPAADAPPPPERAWAEQLDGISVAGELTAAIVSRVADSQADLVLEDGTRDALLFSQMQWARPFLSQESVGAEPQKPADVVAEGDIIWLREVTDEDTGETVWRLAQLPTVQSALVSLAPRTGAIRALVGGYSFNRSHFNRVIQGQRQAGSAFKPFIYSSALLSGLTPATLVNDAPIVFEDSELETAWRPTGAGSKFYGPTRIREALYRSLNLVSIRLLKQVGIGNAVDTLNAFGLPTQRFPRDLSLALGSAAVTPLELATAYSTFANGGFVIQPWFLERVESHDGKLLYQAPDVLLCQSEDCPQADPGSEMEAGDEDGKTSAKPRVTLANGDPLPAPTRLQRSFDARVIWLMDSMLKDVVRRGTAYRASRLGRGDLAGKTGTTNDQVDAWFSGYSPALVATVWVGFDDPSTLGRGEYGGRAALPIWMKYMEKALADEPEQSLPQPSGITTARINKETGKRARPGDPDGIFEYFREENLPEMDSNLGEPGTGDSTAPEQLF
jgi:penicillin-binding protein 1A